MQIIIKKGQSGMFPQNNHNHEYGFGLSKKYNNDTNSQSTAEQQNYHYIDAPNKTNSEFAYRNSTSTPHYNDESMEQNYGFSNTKAVNTKDFGNDSKYHIHKNDIQNMDKYKNNQLSKAALDYRNIKNANLPSFKYKQIYNEIKKKEKDNIQRVPYNVYKSQQQCIQFVYKMVGIISCHVKVTERQNFTLLRNYSRCKKFCIQLENFVKNNLQTAMIALKFNTIQQIQIKQNQLLKDNLEQKKSSISKKYTKIDSLGDSNFILDVSQVEGGLKYLQERAKWRKNDKNQKSNNSAVDNSSRTYNFNNPYQKNPVNGMPKFQPETQNEKKLSPFQFNTKLQRKNCSKKQKNLETSNQPLNVISKALPQQQQDIYLKLQKQSKRKQQEEAMKILSLETGDFENLRPNNLVGYQQNIYKMSRSILLKLHQAPYNAKQRKFVESLQINKLKYHLIPDTLKGQQPDIRQFALPLESHVAYNKQISCSADFELQNYLISHTGQFNLDPSDIEPNLKTQSNLKLDSLPNSQTKKLPKKHSVIKKEEKTNENLISFNQKQTLSKKQRQQQNTSQANQRKVEMQAQQSKKIEIQRKKNENKNQFKDRKCESEGDAIQFNNEITPKINRVDNNGMDQYYTVKKNPIKASFDFPSNTNASKPAERPKSLSHSINGSDSIKQFAVRPVAIHNNNINNTSQLTNFSGDQQKVFFKQKVNAFEPQRNIIQNVITQSVPAPYKIPVFQIGPQFHVQNQNRPIIIPAVPTFNKQIRSVSNQCRYTQPQYFNYPTLQNQIQSPRNFNQIPNASNIPVTQSFKSSAQSSHHFQNSSRQPYFQKEPMPQVREQRSKSNTVQFNYNSNPKNYLPPQQLKPQRLQNMSNQYSSHNNLPNMNIIQPNFNPMMRFYQNPSHKGIQVFSSSGEHRVSNYGYPKQNIPAQLPGNQPRHNLKNSEYF